MASMSFEAMLKQGIRPDRIYEDPPGTPCIMVFAGFKAPGGAAGAGAYFMSPKAGQLWSVRAYVGERSVDEAAYDALLLGLNAMLELERRTGLPVRSPIVCSEHANVIAQLQGEEADLSGASNAIGTDLNPRARALAAQLGCTFAVEKNAVQAAHANEQARYAAESRGHGELWDRAAAPQPIQGQFRLGGDSECAMGEPAGPAYAVHHMHVSLAGHSGRPGGGGSADGYSDRDGGFFGGGHNGRLVFVNSNVCNAFAISREACAATGVEVVPLRARDTPLRLINIYQPDRALPLDGVAYIGLNKYQDGRTYFTRQRFFVVADLPGDGVVSDDLCACSPSTIEKCKICRGHCAACGAVATDEHRLKPCSRCRFIRYCDTNCLLRHWPRHKPVCVPYHREVDKEGNTDFAVLSNEHFDAMMRAASS